jgi:hypothetical protein
MNDQCFCQVAPCSIHPRQQRDLPSVSGSPSARRPGFAASERLDSAP